MLTAVSCNTGLIDSPNKLFFNTCFKTPKTPKHIFKTSNCWLIFRSRRMWKRKWQKPPPYYSKLQPSENYSGISESNWTEIYWLLKFTSFVPNILGMGWLSVFIFFINLVVFQRVNMPYSLIFHIILKILLQVLPSFLSDLLSTQMTNSLLIFTDKIPPRICTRRFMCVYAYVLYIPHWCVLSIAGMP